MSYLDFTSYAKYLTSQLLTLQENAVPHISFEYSGNLDDVVDIGAFCEALRVAAVNVEAFPMPGVRVRGIRVDHYAIADGAPDHGFIDVSIRLRGGRSHAVKAAAAADMFAAAKMFLAPIMAQRSLALSLELREIDPDLSPKTGTIREYIEGSADA